MNFIGTMYTKTTTFLRDIFQYLFCGLLFCGLMLITVQLKGHSWIDFLKKPPNMGDAVLTISFLILCCVFFHIIGQILFSLRCIPFWLYKKCWDKALEKCKRKTKYLEDYLETIPVDDLAESILREAPRHLYFEMVVFVNRPELHRNFVERYNVLRYMRESLSSCFFFVGIASIVALLLPPFAEFSLFGILIPWLSLLLFISISLFRHSILTKKDFLDRVFTSYLVEMKKQSENQIALYFAYGSNINMQQMKRRCPSAKPVSRGELDGYQVKFLLHSVKWGGGVAGIEPEPGGKVEGFVYQMSNNDLETLDTFENVKKGRYYRKKMNISLSDGRRIRAWVYFPNPDPKGPFPPSKKYLKTVIEGARDHEFPEEFIRYLESLSQGGVG